MQPLERQPLEPNSAGEFWLARAEKHAERAARIGFVFSMIFFGAAAAYAFMLSNASRPFFRTAANLADRAAYKAGFRIDRLSLSGNKNAPSKVILDALELPYQGSILSYDTAEARERLLKLGWVEKAEVRRVLPSQLEIAISERTPFARWSSGDKTVLIDRAGKVLGEDEAGKFGHLILFAGEGAPAEAAHFVDALAGHGELVSRIERAELVADRFWAAKLNSGVIAKLPLKVNVLCLQRLETLLSNGKIGELALEAIDLRLPARTILQLKDATVANRDKAIAFLNSTAQIQAAPPRRAKAL